MWIPSGEPSMACHISVTFLLPTPSRPPSFFPWARITWEGICGGSCVPLFSGDAEDQGLKPLRMGYPFKGTLWPGRLLEKNSEISCVRHQMPAMRSDYTPGTIMPGRHALIRWIMTVYTTPSKRVLRCLPGLLASRPVVRQLPHGNATSASFWRKAPSLFFTTVTAGGKVFFSHGRQGCTSSAPNPGYLANLR